MLAYKAICPICNKITYIIRRPSKVHENFGEPFVQTCCEHYTNFWKSDEEGVEFVVWFAVSSSTETVQLELKETSKSKIKG
jgi:hypothetical protein